MRARGLLFAIRANFALKFLALSFHGINSLLQTKLLVGWGSHFSPDGENVRTFQSPKTKLDDIEAETYEGAVACWAVIALGLECSPENG